MKIGEQIPSGLTYEPLESLMKISGFIFKAIMFRGLNRGDIVRWNGGFGYIRLIRGDYAYVHELKQPRDERGYWTVALSLIRTERLEKVASREE